MPIYVWPILILGLISTWGYFRGRNTNRRISGAISEVLQDAFAPLDTNYTNIGGTIGHNARFELSPPLTELKATLTMLPRQSVLYYPISRLIVRYDRLYLNVFTSRRLLGEGHIISADYYPRMRVSIAGESRLKRDEMMHQGRRFILLWDRSRVAGPLREYLKGLTDASCLKHFCCYRDNDTFFLFIAPRKESTERAVKHFAAGLASFMAPERSAV